MLEMAVTAGRRPAPATSPDRAREALVPIASAAFWVSVALTAVAAIAAAATLFGTGALRGTAVMNGSARGTAVVALFVAVPLLALSMVAAERGSARALITWLGAVTYLLYNAVLFLLATPFNRLFLLYVAMFALAVWAIATLLHRMDVPTFARRYGGSLPARALATYLAAVAALNALAWLAQVVPAVLSDQPPAFLAGTGLTTNPIYAQDLSFWIPLTAVTAYWLWRRRPWGLVLAGALLTYLVIESVGIAADQAFGHAADPASTVASAAAVPLFAVVAVIGLVPLLFYYRNLDRRSE
jgi:hypothetical protein